IPFAARAIMGESVLDAANHPQIRFESTRVASAGEGHVTVTGQATLRGVTREVTLDAVIYRPPGSDPGVRDDLTVLITGTISRAAFGASGHAGSVGDAVRLRILLHVLRAGGCNRTAAVAARGRATAGKSSARGDWRWAIARPGDMVAGEKARTDAPPPLLRCPLPLDHLPPARDRRGVAARCALRRGAGVFQG